MPRHRIYLAGPAVFDPDPVAVFAKMKAICEAYGLDGAAPLDNQMGLEGQAASKELMLRIVQADFALMDQLDAGIFCLDPFRRATEMDAGTAVEIGYMKAQGKPMAGWTTDGRSYPEKVAAFFEKTYGLALIETEANVTGGTSGSHRDPDGILVHSQGMVQNGMTQGAIELSGGRVFADPDWIKAFTQAVCAIKHQLDNHCGAGAGREVSP